MKSIYDIYWLRTRFSELLQKQNWNFLFTIYLNMNHTFLTTICLKTQHNTQQTTYNVVVYERRQRPFCLLYTGADPDGGHRAQGHVPPLNPYWPAENSGWSYFTTPLRRSPNQLSLSLYLQRTFRRYRRFYTPRTNFSIHHCYSG